MSFNDKMAALPGILADKLEYVTATVTRTATVKTDEDRDAGRKGTATTTTIIGRGKLGTRLIRRGDGTKEVESFANLLLPAAPKIGDKLAIGAITLTIETVRETNTIGRPLATKFKVTLK